MPVSIHIDVDVPMEMRDGAILRANIYRPDDNQKHPAIFCAPSGRRMVVSGTLIFLELFTMAMLSPGRLSGAEAPLKVIGCQKIVRLRMVMTQ